MSPPRVALPSSLRYSSFILLPLLHACVVSPGQPRSDDGTPQPDLLIVVLDTTSAEALDEAMPQASAFLDAGVRFDHAVAPSNNTTETTASVFANSWVNGSVVVTSDPISLPEHLRNAGYTTLFASSNGVLDQGFFRRDFDWSRVEEDHDGFADAATVDAFLEAWEAAPSPRFGWVQLAAGHDYRSENPLGALSGGHVTDESRLPEVWTVYARNLAQTDALLPRLLGANADGLTALTADHGEQFADRGPTLLPSGPVHGHGLANTPLEIRVPLGLVGPGIAPELRTQPVTTLDLHSTLTQAAGLPVYGGNLLAMTELRPAGFSTCGIGDTGGAGHWMASVLRADGSELVRTSATYGLPSWLIWDDHGGADVSGSWHEVARADVAADELELLEGLAAPDCSAVQDLCDEHPELEFLGYVECP